VPHSMNLPGRNPGGMGPLPVVRRRPGLGRRQARLPPSHGVSRDIMPLPPAFRHGRRRSRSHTRCSPKEPKRHPTEEPTHDRPGHHPARSPPTRLIVASLAYSK
jgi:hypothetical protein